jgi:hypothetical protein
MRNRTLLCALLCCVCAAGFAKDKTARDWKTGRVVDLGSEHFTSRGGTTTSGRVDSQGNIQTTSSQTTWRHERDTFVIDAGDRIIIGYQVLSFRWSKACPVTLGENIQYAVEKGTLHVLADNGKDCSMRLQRQTLK